MFGFRLGRIGLLGQQQAGCRMFAQRGEHSALILANGLLTENSGRDRSERSALPVPCEST
jgi:hypothetical protein